METDKRVLIAFALSFAILMIFRVFIFKEAPQPKTPATASAPTTQPAGPPATPGAASPSAAAPQGNNNKKVAAAVPVALPVERGAKAEDVVVEAGLYRVTFSTQGAVVKSWVLTKYQDAENKPLDVVNHDACDTLGYPMSIDLGDPSLTSQLNSAVYVVKPPSGTLTAPAKLEFAYSDGKVRVDKQFTFGTGYEVSIKVSVSDGQHDLPVQVEWPGGFGDHSLADAVKQALQLAAYDNAGKIETLAQKKVKESHLIPGPLQFAGAEDKYFAGIFVPSEPSEVFRVARQDWAPPGWKDPKNPPNPMLVALASPEPEPAPLAFRMFVGPKDLDALRAFQPRLDGLLDFGWFGIIAKPIFVAMLYIYDHWVHNYGWAIVLLTLIINLALFPLKVKSIRSAQEMQRVQPIIKGIQDKYKGYKFNDPRKQKMNQEVMKIYSEHGINPLGGCLPMALQLPILYAFYRVLDLPIELRHAPWIWWVKDLSQPDTSHLFGIPVPVLPTIMIVTMFFLQKMTPMATTDPSQKRMMFLMPLIFGIMFYRLASGLVLYFLAANLVGIAQQLIINKMMPLKPLAGPALAAKAQPAKT